MTHRLLCCIGSLDGGGSERQLLQFASCVDPALFDPRIYLLHRRGPLLEQVPGRIPVYAFPDAVHASRAWLPGQTHARQVADLKALIQREGIDVVYDRTFHMTLVTAAACRASGTPRVSVIVSPPSKDFQSSRERFRGIKRARLAKAYKMGTTVAVSDDVADDAADYYRLDRKQILVIPNPVDIEGVRAAAKQCAAPEDFLAADLRIVIVGRLSQEKGQALAIRALAEARRLKPAADIHLEILGDGPLRDELVELAGKMQVEGQVHFRGFVPNPYPSLAQADLVCIPSRYEGLPNVALETLALAKPLLATNCSEAIVELVGAGNDRGSVIPIDDAHAMAQQFVDRIENPEIWLQRAACGAEWVRTHHALPQWLQAMHSCLNEAVESRTRRLAQGRRL